MSTYEPGTVAMIRDSSTSDRSEWRAVKQDKGWLGLDEGMGWVEDYCVTDVRPLVVLDTRGEPMAAKWLRKLAEADPHGDTIRARIAKDIAAQIEAQVKPPRIPEPGLWGVVEANGAKWLRWTSDPKQYQWTRVSGDGLAVKWDELINPTLIREGVQS